MKANYTDSLSIRLLCPLLAFNCAPEIIDLNLDYRPASVELSKAIQIKQVPTEFMDYLSKNYPDSPDIFSAEYMLVLSLPAISGYKIDAMTELPFKASNLLFDLITSFRLCHRGGVTPGPLLYSNIKDSEFYVYGWSHVPSLFMEFLPSISKKEVDPTSFELLEYEFSSSDVPVVNKLLSEISNCRKSGQFTTLYEALRRFNSAYSGESEDRLIDQMIAFESLYIADNKELTYKLALRTAFLLGKTRTKIFNDMQKAYGLRGQIVHGNMPVDKTKLEDTVPKTEEYLRLSIRKFLSLSKQYPISEIRKRLDENILKNGKPLALKD